MSGNDEYILRSRIVSVGDYFHQESSMSKMGLRIENHARAWVYKEACDIRRRMCRNTDALWRKWHDDWRG